MRLLIYDGVRYLLNSSTEEAIGEFHRQLPMIRADIAGMKASQFMPQKWFNREDKWRIQEQFGIVTVKINSSMPEMPPPKPVPIPRRTMRVQYLPAIEAYDQSGNFKGIIICNSGTFEDPYDFVPCDQSDLDPFLWGQWREHFNDIPYTERDVKFITETNNSISNKRYYDVPNTAELLADFNQTTSEESYNVDWEASPPEVEILCHLHPDPLCTGNTCRAIRVETWRFTVNESMTYQDFFEIYDENWDLTGEAISGTESIYSYTGNGNNAFIKGPSLEHACTAPGEAPNPCSYCEARIADTTALPFNSPAALYPTPGVWGLVGANFVWDAEQIYNEDDLIIGPTWYAWTNIESADSGGMNAVFESSRLSRKRDRNNGALAGPIDDVITGWDASVRTYATTTTVDTETYSWKEGAIVDGVTYVAFSGDGMYGDVADPIYYDKVHPRYWNIGYYMSSARRKVSGDFIYYHVDFIEEVLVATTFLFSHILNGTYYHTIPGFSDLFGMGYFRLVKIEETKEYSD